jgi:hypothetical protein
MDWTQLGIAALVVIVVLAFLRFLKSEREDRAVEREGLVKTIENHINHNTEVQDEQNKAMREFSETIKVFSERVRNCPAKGE